MFISEYIPPAPDTLHLNTDKSVGWYTDYFSTQTITSKPKPVVDYWEGIAKSVQGENPSEALLSHTPSSSESPILHASSSQPENNGGQGILPIIGPIYARSKLLRRAFNTLALLSIAANPMSAPRQTEASGSLLPVAQEQPVWRCIGLRQASEKSPMCAVLHGGYCSPNTAKHIDENNIWIEAETKWTTSLIEGSKCLWRCEDRTLLGDFPNDPLHNHIWGLIDVCYKDAGKWVTDLTGIDLSSDSSQSSNSTNTSGSFGGGSDVPIPQYNGEVQPGGDGLCSFDLTGPVDQSDPDCTLGGLFRGGNSQSAPATENTAPPITEQVPNVPAPVNTTDTTDWQTPTTTGDSCEVKCAWVQSHYKDGTPRDPNTPLAKASGNICKSNCRD